MSWRDIEPPRRSLARVFVRDNVFCPHDEDAYFDEPGLTTPFYDEVHVSCTFTWDRARSLYLQEKWRSRSNKVLVGGPAYNSPTPDFIPGKYVDRSVTFTTRGCVRHCPKCFVPRREGLLRELDPIHAASIVQDNNLFACSDRHWDKVMAMLRTRTRICFKGGFDARLATAKRISDLAAIQHHVAELFTACDEPEHLPATVAFIQALKAAGYPRWKIRCYMIIGTNMTEEEQRLREIYRAGSLPFAQLYRGPDDAEVYPSVWKDFQKTWCRPPATKAHCKELGIL